MHCLGPEHDTQTPPPLPQSLFAVPATQLFPLQQPAQLAESQTQVPIAQRCPAAQGAWVPHRQAPLLSQVFVLSVEQLAQRTAPRPQVVTVEG
jgi:hypothetical protein